MEGETEAQGKDWLRVTQPGNEERGLGLDSQAWTHSLWHLRSSFPPSLLLTKASPSSGLCGALPPPGRLP